MSTNHSGKTKQLEVYRQSLRQPKLRMANVANMARAAAQADGAAGQDDEPIVIPDGIVKWLAQLTLLYGVPFEYLVPDAAMLPPESIRFFYVDQNWTNRLVDGAVNIALGSTQDYVHILTTFEQTAQAAAVAQGLVRAQLRGKPAPATLAVGGTLTGVLLRSAVVAGWPGMEVSAFSDQAGTQALPLLRMDRLSDNVLLCIFNGVPELVNFSEPPEGLHFGVIGNPAWSPPPPTTQAQYQVALRGVGGKFPAGQQINDAHGNAYTSPITFRASVAGVLDIAQIQADLTANLNAQGALNGSPPLFTASQFAVQMIKGAGLQQFEPGTGKTCNGNVI
ncbi:hypothetical protein CSZ94_12085 [Janthinobacterium sp. ROICE36]|uniref:hypothetical protein n=1 Tax=Janthinobacterium sp. ROICE36 TaxID=2048670 RepID=UPI000C7EB9BF|nr:hypothetical protein [Janthinobacterium sp. ROICE36]PLY42112.1 hypothetical protein CSZ94_12085 [Janthinobacterium sp. ROICE36]